MNLSQIVRDLRSECEDRWPTPSPSDSLIWTFTELGELADECARLPSFMDVRPTRNHPRDASLARLSDEAADVLIMLTTLCNSVGIELEVAFMRRVRELLERYRAQGGQDDSTVQTTH